ncbi:MAG TPA: hypothetical protein VIR61_05615, partial [Sulfuricaulis sp.]
VTLKEGRNREVRRLWEAVGAKVSRLMRVRYGPVALPPYFHAGRSAALDEAATAALYEQAGLKPPMPKKSTIKSVKRTQGSGRLRQREERPQKKSRVTKRRAGNRR